MICMILITTNRNICYLKGLIFISETSLRESIYKRATNYWSLLVI